MHIYDLFSHIKKKDENVMPFSHNVYKVLIINNKIIITVLFLFEWC